jgi:hypothetical protein
MAKSLDEGDYEFRARVEDEQGESAGKGFILTVFANPKDSGNTVAQAAPNLWTNPQGRSGNEVCLP